jgi:hypothetical protein
VCHDLLQSDIRPGVPVDRQLQPLAAALHLGRIVNVRDVDQEARFGHVPGNRPVVDGHSLFPEQASGLGGRVDFPSLTVHGVDVDGFDMEKVHDPLLQSVNICATLSEA